ncbi:MAG: hypothetical protein Q7R76_01160 [Candidatus Woesearchaeota archaeon]|nr:hypothetical protein [Candidatus Woesearchaeota archaeon]
MQKSPPQKLHAGLRGLLEYTALLIIAGIVTLAYMAAAPTTLGAIPLLPAAELVLVVWLVAVLYGFFARKPWVWAASLVCFSFVLVYSLVLHYYLLQFQLVPFELFLLLSLFSFLMNGTVLWYVFQKKIYFTNPYYTDHFGVADRLFVNILLCLLVLLLAISITVLKLFK